LSRNAIRQPTDTGKRNSNAQPERVSEREERDDGVARLERHVPLRVEDVPQEAPVREHDPLGEARRSRGVDDGGEVLRPGAREGLRDARRRDVSRRGVGLPERGGRPLAPEEEGREVLRGEDGPDARHLLRVEALEERVGRQEQGRLGVVEDVVDVLLAEIREDRDRDRPEGDDREPGRRPARRVASEKADLRPRLHVQLAEGRVDPGDPDRDVGIGHRGPGKSEKAGSSAFRRRLRARSGIRLSSSIDRPSYDAPSSPGGLRSAPLGPPERLRE
jgi:hypothetical protein